MADSERDFVVQFSETDVKGEVGFINAEGPPVPIPNTEVKLCSADNTSLATVREDRSKPTPRIAERMLGYLRKKVILYFQWGCSSVGRAPALQAGGHGFESHHLHQGRGEMRTNRYRLIAQQVRARA